MKITVANGGDIQTEGNGDSMTELAQWGRLSESRLGATKKDKKHFTFSLSCIINIKINFINVILEKDDVFKQNTFFFNGINIWYPNCINICA